MKMLTILFLFVICITESFAVKNLDLVKRVEVEEIQKLIKLGHENIESDLKVFTLNSYERFINYDSIRYEQRVKRSDVLSSIKCIQVEKCELYKLEISSEFYGGWGFSYTLLEVSENKIVGAKSYRAYQE